MRPLIKKICRHCSKEFIITKARPVKINKAGQVLCRPCYKKEHRKLLKPILAKVKKAKKVIKLTSGVNNTVDETKAKRMLKMNKPLRKDEETLISLELSRRGLKQSEIKARILKLKKEVVKNHSKAMKEALK